MSETLELVPDCEETALYHIFGDEDLLLYIGISNDFGRRWQEHARKQPWWTERRRMTTEWHGSRPEAEEAEATAIKAEHPKYNKQHNGVPRPAARKRSAARLKAVTADSPPAWIPVRIPDDEGLPLHPLDRVPGLNAARFRPPGVFTWTERAFCDVASAEKLIASVPEEGRYLFRNRLQYWRANYEVACIAWRSLQDAYALEVTETRPDVIALLKRHKASCREFLGLPCFCCEGEPSTGMTCGECGTSGPAFSLAGHPASIPSPAREEAA